MITRVTRVECKNACKIRNEEKLIVFVSRLKSPISILDEKGWYIKVRNSGSNGKMNNVDW